MHQFVTVHNAKHTSKTTDIVFENVKVKSLLLAPVFNNSTDHGWVRSNSNFFFVLLKQRQCRSQKEDSSAYSQSSRHRMDSWIRQVFLFVNQTNFIRKSMEWNKHWNASCHFCITFQTVNIHYSKHISTLPAYDICALCFCISNLQRGSKNGFF